MAAATGDIVGYLTSDDVYASEDVLQKEPGRLPKMKSMPVMAISSMYDRTTCRASCVTASRPDSHGMIERGWIPAHPTLFVRRSILQEHRGFDIRYRYQSDFELMVRLFLKERISAAHIPEVLVHMRTGELTNRSLRNVFKGNLEAYRACWKDRIKVSPLFILQKVGSRLPQYFLRPPGRTQVATPR
jgi:hypothetical protein